MDLGQCAASVKFLIRDRAGQFTGTFDAERGPEDEARAALNEAVSLYEGLQAQWDIRRAEARLRSCGIRRGVRGRPGPRMVSGWEALTLTEVKIAALVARGDSTSDIARGMFLSRRTVQTYISRILTKLGTTNRVAIAGEALRRGISPERDGRPVHRRESIVI